MPRAAHIAVARPASTRWPSSSPAAAAWAACSARPTALYHDLGFHLADTHGIATVRVGYRKPNDLSRCVHDVAAAADLASRSGARSFVVIGHSFGGAVAIQAASCLSRHCRGVVTLATQSAGCEDADELGDTPLLLFHGTDDEILPAETSAIVQMLAGHGEVVMLPGDGHLLTEVGRRDPRTAVRVDPRGVGAVARPGRRVRCRRAWRRSARTRRRSRRRRPRRTGPTSRGGVAAAR